MLVYNNKLLDSVEYVSCEDEEDIISGERLILLLMYELNYGNEKASVSKVELEKAFNAELDATEDDYKKACENVKERIRPIVRAKQDT